MATVCRILILQQMNLEKNGFQRFEESQISFHTIQNYYLKPAFCRNLKQSGSTPVYQVLTSEQTHNPPPKKKKKFFDGPGPGS